MRLFSTLSTATMAAMAMLVASCAKEQSPPANADTPNVARDYNSIAKVNSPEAINDLLTKSGGNLTRSDAAACVDFGENFVSMMDVAEVIDNVPVTYYEHNEFDELVPNTDLASLLNTKGEIQVGDTMYRITKAGTYYFAPPLRDIVDAMIEEFDETTGTHVDKWTVSVADGIMRRNTFKVDEEDAETGEPDSYTESFGFSPSYGESNSKPNEEGMTRGMTGPVVYPSYPTYFVDAHTVVGEFLEGIFGRNKSYEEYFSKNRRLKGKLYYYDYKFYSEMGALGKFQKKQWIGWHKTNAERIGVVWTDVMVEFTVSDPNPATPAPVYKAPVCLGTYIGSVPGGSGTILVLGGVDTSSKGFKDAVIAGKRAIESYLGVLIPRGITFKAILFIQGNKASTLFSGDAIMEYNVESVRKVFKSDFGVEINIPSKPGNALAWFKAIRGKVSGTPLKSAKCMVEAYHAGGRKGMILVKRFD